MNKYTKITADIITITFRTVPYVPFNEFKISNIAILSKNKSVI